MPKLLLVDDDDAIRRMIRVELSDTYEIIDTGLPEEGLALAMEHRPEAILLDLRMPKYSGYELCERFTSFSRTQMIPVVIVSGEAGSQTKEYCKQLGAAGYFEKPIDFAALRTCLSRLAVRRDHTPRSEVSVQLRLPLKLLGTNSKGEQFEEIAETETVSLNGFLCSCNTELKVNSLLDVYMTSNGNHHVGKASIVRVDSKAASSRLYGCRFIEKTGPWVLK